MTRHQPCVAGCALLLARPPKRVTEDFHPRSEIIALMIRHRRHVAIAGCVLTRRFLGGGHPLVAGARCRRPVDLLLARLPNGVNEDFGARSAVAALMIERQRDVASAGCALARRFRGGGHPLVAGALGKRPVDLLIARLPNGLNEDFGAWSAVVALMIQRQRDVAIAGCALARRFRGGGHTLAAGVRGKHPDALFLAQLPKWMNKDFGARSALVIERQREVAIAGCALTRRFRGSGRRLVAGMRGKHSVDRLLARFAKRVNRDFNGRSTVVASRIQRQRD